MRTSKVLAAAVMAVLAAPAMACDLEAFGEQRFSAFGGMHMGGQPASDPAPAPSEQQQGGGAESESINDQSSGGGDAPTEDADGASKPASGADGQGDAATFR